MLILACVNVESVGLPFIKMEVDHGEDRCCGLSKVGMVETVGFRQVMWFVMVESAKDQILGVDTPGQHVSPCVWYGTTCLLIRNTLGSVSDLVERRGTANTSFNLPGARGAIATGILSNAMVLRIP